MSARYTLLPKADLDLDDQALYLSEQATPEFGHRFLVAAHETFTLLASQPEMGWRPHLRKYIPANLRVFRVSGFDNILIIYQPRTDGVEILRVVHGARNLQALFLRGGFLP